MAIPDQARNELQRRLQEACRNVMGAPGWRLVRLDLFALARQAAVGDRAAGIYDAVARIERQAEADLLAAPEVHTMPGVNDA